MAQRSIVSCMDSVLQSPRVVPSAPLCSLAPCFHLPSPPLLDPLNHTHLPCLDGSNQVPEGWWAHIVFWLDLGPRQVGSWMCSVSEAGKWYLSLPRCDDVTDIQGDDLMGPPPSLIQGLSISTVTVAIPWGPESPCVGNIDLLALAWVLYYHFALDSAKCVARSNLM